MPLAVGVIFTDGPAAEPLMPLPVEGEAVHTYEYVLGPAAFAAVRVVEAFWQMGEGDTDAVTRSGVVTLAITATRLLSQRPFTSET